MADQLLVKHTKLSIVRPGDILLYSAQGLGSGDVLGEIIVMFEGGKLRYTHAASVRDVPDPEAPVVLMPNGKYKVVEKSWKAPIQRETPFEGKMEEGEVLRNTMGVKLEATWPKCREWSIDWENDNMSVWRIRNLSPQNIIDILRMQQDMVGIGRIDLRGNHNDAWDYNLAEFLSFGFLNQAAAKICSEFVADPVYVSTLLRGCANGNYPIALTPDLRGNRDPEKTPNELALSGFAYHIDYQGLLEA
jgi:hypothetical protein